MQIMMGMRDELFSGMECVRKFKVRIEDMYLLYVLVFRKWAVGNQKLRALSCRAQTAIIS